MKKRKERPRKLEEFTLQELGRFEADDSWPKGLRALFWTFDDRVPEEYRGDGPFNPRQCLTMTTAEFDKWTRRRGAWEAKRSKWLQKSAGTRVRGKITT